MVIGSQIYIFVYIISLFNIKIKQRNITKLHVDVTKNDINNQALNTKRVSKYDVYLYIATAIEITISPNDFTLHKHT